MFEFSYQQDISNKLYTIAASFSSDDPSLVPSIGHAELAGRFSK
jgi:hypothetical protein